MTTIQQVSWSDLPAQLRKASELASQAIKNGKSVLLIGPAGCGKTMVARRLHTLLPPLKSHIEINAIYRMAGMKQLGLLSRPFRAPHHTCSMASFIGNGATFCPGELSLAHEGVLFLDEVAEFSKSCLELVERAYARKIIKYGGKPSLPLHLVSLPADFSLVAATNSCPCGNATWKCECTKTSITNYHARYSMLQFDVIVDLRANSLKAKHQLNR